MASTQEYSKHFDLVHGYTMDEAIKAKENIDRSNGVGDPNSKWDAAKIVPDCKKKDGYMLVAHTHE